MIIQVETINFDLKFIFNRIMAYVFVLTTSDTFAMGNYQLIVQGLNRVNMRKLDNICNTITPNEITSIYSSSLTRNSLTFHRDLRSKIYYYRSKSF